MSLVYFWLCEIMTAVCDIFMSELPWSHYRNAIYDNLPLLCLYTTDLFNPIATQDAVASQNSILVAYFSLHGRDVCRVNVCDSSLSAGQ